MSEQSDCPWCGCPVTGPGPAAGEPAAAVIAAMDAEIRKLRETVALLRGARAG